MGLGKPFLPNLKDLIAAGIDPKTGLPLKLVAGTPADIAENARRAFRIMDEQNAVNRFTWMNLPDGLDGKLLERIIYYKGQGAFFYWEELQQFFFLPFTLAAGLDLYGRYKSIKPIPFMGSLDDKGASDLGISYEVQYGIQLQAQNSADLKGKAVLLRDYTQQLSQTILPRAMLQEWVLQNMGELVAFLRTRLIKGTGIDGLKCNSADQVGEVKELARGMIDAALRGEPFMGISGSKIDLDSLDKSGGSEMRAEDYLIALQALDNIRLGFYGLDNGGIFEKKAHITNQELAMNSGSVGLVLEDSLSNRKEFCDIVNSIWGLGIDVEVSETVTGMDRNRDGMVEDDPTAPVETPEEEGEDDSALQS